MNRYAGDVEYREDSGGGGFSLRDILYVLFMRKWQMAAFFVVVLVAGIVVAMRTPVYFQSKATLFIKPGRELQMMDPALVDSRSSIRTQELMRSEQAILESRDQAEFVVDSLGLDYFRNMVKQEADKGGELEGSLAPIAQSLDKLRFAIDKVSKGTGENVVELTDEQLREMAIWKVMGGLKVERRDNLITLTYADTDGKRAHDFLCCIMDSYKSHRSRIYQVSPEYFRKETARIQSQLEEKEKALGDYLADLNVSSLEDEHGVLLEQYGSLDRQIIEAGVIISASETKIRSVELMAASSPEGARIAGVGGGSRGTSIIEIISRKILELELEEVSKSNLYPPNSVQMRNLRSEKERLQALLEQQQSAAGAEAAEGIEVSGSALRGASTEVELALAYARIELEGQKARRQALISEWNKVKERLTQLQRHKTPIEKLKREKQILEDAYMKYSASLQDAEILAAMDTETENSVKVIQAATLPWTPDKKTRNRILGASAFIAFFGSFAFAFLLDFLSNRVKTPEEIERKLGIPVLASFPRTRQHTVRLASAEGSWSGRALAPFKRKVPGAVPTETKEKART